MAQEWPGRVVGGAPAQAPAQPAPAPSQFPGVIQGRPKPPPEPTPKNPYDVETDQRDYSADRGDTAFSQASSLRKEFRSSPNFQAYDVALGAFNSSLKTGSDAQGDQSLITAYAKMLDPTSAVREGEFATTANTENMINQIKARLAKEFGYKDGGMISDAGRAAIRREMLNLVQQRFRPAYERERSEFEGYAKTYGFDPALVIGSDLFDSYKGSIEEFQSSLGVGGGPAPQGTVAADQTRYSTEEDRRKAAGLRQLYVSGASMGQMVDYLKAQGETPDFQQLRSLKEQIDYRDGQGDYKGVKPTQQDLERQIVTPTSGTRGGIGAAVADFATSTPGAFVTGALDFHGGLDEIVSGVSGADLATVNQTKQAVRETSPIAYFGGQLAGNLAGAAGLARFAPNVARAAVATPAAAAGSAAAVGGAQGALEQNDNRVLGGVTGAALGGALGYGGARVGNALAQRAADQATQAPARNALADAGRAEGVTVNRAMMNPNSNNAMTRADASPVTGPRVQREMQAIEGQFEDRVTQLGRGGSAMLDETGGANNLALGNTVRGASERFIEKSGATARKKYDRAERLAGDAKVEPKQSLAAVDEMIATLSETPNSNKAEIAFLQEIKDDLGKELSVGGLRRMRTNLRKKISKGDLVFGEDEARVLAIMDNAADDIRNGLTAQGKADAARAFDVADKSYRARMEYITNTVQKVIGKRGQDLSGEDVARRFNTMSRQDVVGLRRLYATMDPEERADVAATFAETLGRNNKDGFTIARFMRQTKGLSDEAARTLYGKEGFESIKNLRTLGPEIERVTGAMNSRTSKSGVANYRDYLISFFFGGGLSGLSGDVLATGAGALAAAGGKAGYDTLIARSLMSPEITRWIKTAPKTTKPAAIDAHYKRLLTIAGGQTPAAEPAKMLSEMIMKAANDTGAAPLAAEQQDPNEGG